MVFSSILFLFRFMPAAFAIYYLVPRRFKNFTLLVLSLIFYSWGEAKYFPIMIASIVVDYTASGLIESHRDNKLICRLGLIYSMVFNLGMLGFFKYTNFFVGNLNALFGLSLPTISFVLPLGISFYTFQTMSYTIDVYLGKVKAERNIIDFGAFVVLFPQLIAGPIVRYTDINRELKERQINLPQIQDGIKLFILGLGSKVLIANNVGALWTEIEAIGAVEGFLSISTPLAWMAVFAYSLQIYFDFSGYSLMAIGLGKMLGFEFPKNFDFPYISRSFGEFWRRWHMTLGAWFREYLYIPLGGNRVSKPRLYFNLFVVWAATGFWHGASWNFVFWGLFFFVTQVVERMGFRSVPGPSPHLLPCVCDLLPAAELGALCRHRPWHAGGSLHPDVRTGGRCGLDLLPAQLYRGLYSGNGAFHSGPQGALPAPGEEQCLLPDLLRRHLPGLHCLSGGRHLQPVPVLPVLMKEA